MAQCDQDPVVSEGGSRPGPTTVQEVIGMFFLLNHQWFQFSAGSNDCCYFAARNMYGRCVKERIGIG